MAEIRDVQIMQQFGHIPNAQVVKIENVSISGTGDTTIYSTPSGKLFVVYQLYLLADAVAVSFTAKSGSNIIGTYVLASNGIMNLWNAGLPVFIGRADGENFILNASSGSPVLKGHAAIGYINLPQ